MRIVNKMKGFEVIRFLRQANGMNGRELSKRTGISQSHISEIENGHKDLSREYVEKLAKAFKIKVSELEALVEGAEVEIRKSKGK